MVLSLQEALAYRLLYGQIPHLRRSCNDPRCVNPNHRVPVARSRGRYRRLGELG